jgi:hypothetical protein
MMVDVILALAAALFAGVAAGSIVLNLSTPMPPGPVPVLGGAAAAVFVRAGALGKTHRLEIAP